MRELRNLLECAPIVSGGRAPDAQLFLSLLESSLPDSEAAVGAGSGATGGKLRKHELADR